MKENSKVLIYCSASVYLEDMELEDILVQQEFTIEQLLALGVEQQEDICDSLTEQLDEVFENNPNYFAIGESYISCIVQQPREGEELFFDQSMISPRLRGLYGKYH